MSANASKGKIITLDDHRKARLTRHAGPPPFDPQAIMQRIRRARLAPNPEERALAVSLALSDAELMIQLLGVMGAEIAGFRQQVKILAQQSADTATINAVLLALLGGEVRVDAKWFEDFEVKGGLEVTEEENEVVIRSLVIDAPAASGVPSVSASQQTEDD